MKPLCPTDRFLVFLLVTFVSYTGTGPFLVWESRALRLLTIFFCGPTIVTPTFFRSLIWEGEGERRGERRGRRGQNIGTGGEGEVGGDEGNMERKQIEKCALVIEEVTPFVISNDMLPAPLVSLSLCICHSQRTTYPRRPLG